MRTLSLVVAAGVWAGCVDAAKPTVAVDSAVPGRLPGPSVTPVAVPSSDGLRPVDENQRVLRIGNLHPQANPGNDLGPVEPSFAMEHLQLVLKRDPRKEAAFEARIDAMHDSSSPLFHQWMTAAQIGEEYGPSDAVLLDVERWLGSHGLQVEDVPPSRMFVVFSGTAAQVAEAFGTEIHRLDVHGTPHYANMTEPSIPAALDGVVEGVTSLSDFRGHSLVKSRGNVHRGPDGRWETLGTSNPGLTSVDGGVYFYVDGGGIIAGFGVAPGDFATIYNIAPLWDAGYRGAGETIAVVEDTELVNVSDVATFRTAFGLSGYAGTYSQGTAGSSFGCTNAGTRTNALDEGEAALDAEWAGATAPDAKVVLAQCNDVGSVGGWFLATENLVNGANPPQIISMSYGYCESANGATNNQDYVNTFQQAAAEGVSVFVSAGDEGAASCDADEAFAQNGIAVSGYASTPYNMAVGGTDFMDTYNSLNGGPAMTTYWNLTNTATFSSALSYIPEIPWNDSCASKLFYSYYGYAQPYGAGGFCNTPFASTGQFITTASGSGGPSSYSAQPAWQTGVVGLPTKSGGVRNLPDVSLFAANGYWSHYLVECMSDTTNGAGGGPCLYNNTPDLFLQSGGGTSFAAPALAGIQALVNQYTGSSQGNPAPRYYKLAAAEFGARGSTRCNSSAGSPGSPATPDSTCIFHDITQGDIDVPCYGTGAAANCLGSSGTSRHPVYGALSTSTAAYDTAYAASTGWDYATGLGSINVTNLVTQW